MNQTPPKRIAIIGLPGSGKSTFASKLGKLLNVPVHHLDRHMFEPDGKKRDKQDLLEIQKEMLSEEAWIIEGCALSSLEMRFKEADTLIYFHYSWLLCFWRLVKRLFNHDKAFGGLRTVNLELLKYIWTFDREKGPAIEALREKYPQVEFCVFRNPKEAEEYWSSHASR